MQTHKPIQRQSQKSAIATALLNTPYETIPAYYIYYDIQSKHFSAVIACLFVLSFKMKFITIKN